MALGTRGLVVTTLIPCRLRWHRLQCSCREEAQSIKGREREKMGHLST